MEKKIRTDFQRFLGTVINIIHMFRDKVLPLVEIPLVKAVQIRQVDLEPSQTALAKGL